MRLEAPYGDGMFYPPTQTSDQLWVEHKKPQNGCRTSREQTRPLFHKQQGLEASFRDRRV